MNLKITSIVLAWASALGISYFAFDLLTSLGDWAQLWVTSPYILIVSLIVTVPPVIAVWLGIILIEQAKTKKGDILWLLGTSVPAWVWLYAGAIYVALLRLQ